MASDGMTIRLHLRRMKVGRVVVDEIDELVIEVVDPRSVVRCGAISSRSSGAGVTSASQPRRRWNRPAEPTRRAGG